MRLVTYKLDNNIRLGFLTGSKVVDLQGAHQLACQAGGMPAASQPDCFSSMQALLAAGDEAWEMARHTHEVVIGMLKNKDNPVEKAGLLVGLDHVELLAPVPAPGKVICIAGNFPAAGKAGLPDYPIIFLKPSTTITGSGSPILLANIATSAAYEVELAVVIGKRAHNVPHDDASGCIAGFTIANDVGDRQLEKRTSQWTTGKMFDTFTPLGPALLTPDEVPDTHNLRMETWVNDEKVQMGNTGDMFFDVDFLIGYLSHLTTLEPGDVILTGSPKLMKGQPAPQVTLKPGDTVRVSVGELGELINPVMEEPA
jgi:acylpyruvate hydrolase